MHDLVILFSQHILLGVLKYAVLPIILYDKVSLSDCLRVGKYFYYISSLSLTVFCLLLVSLLDSEVFVHLYKVYR